MSVRPVRRNWFGGLSAHARILLAVVLVCAFVFPLFILGIKYPETFTVLLGLYNEHFDFSLPSAQVYINAVSVLLAGCLWGTFVQYRRALTRESALNDVINSISPDVLVVLGPDGKVVMCNAAMKRMLGYDDEEVRLRPCHFLAFAEPDASTRQTPANATYAEAGFRIRYAQCTRKGGDIIPLEVITGQLQGREGEVLLLRDITERLRAENELLAAKDDLERRVVERTAELVRVNDGLKHEITERKLAEEEREHLRSELLQAQKLEAIGLLAGGIAHDFNNLLTAIVGHLHLASETVREHADPQRHLSLAGQACERAAELIGKLLQFSRKAPLTHAPINLNETIASFAEMVRSVIGDRVTLTLDLCADPLPIVGDASSLERVLMNLTVNARDAMPEGGVIRISTTNAVLGAAEVRAMNGARPGRFLRLRVEDTGVGMSREVLARIFEPFFTTKGPGKGTGLGLAGTYGTIKQHGGWIVVWSKEGLGSHFTVYLPAGGEPQVPSAAESDQGLNQEPPPPAAARQGGTLLVVEDEEAVRRLAVHCLARQGYTVLQADSVHAALGILELQGGMIDLVFSDVTLPDGTGIALADRVRRSWPAVRLLLTSGDTSGELRLEDIGERAIPFIRKPYDLHSLALKVESILPLPAA